MTDQTPVAVPPFKLVLPQQKSSLFGDGWTGISSIYDGQPASADGRLVEMGIDAVPEK